MAASAVRTLTRTLTIMPMKPAAADRQAPTTKPTAVSQPRPQPCLAPSATRRIDEDDHADHGDGPVLAAEVGLGALLHGAGHLLHDLASPAGSSSSQRMSSTP